MVSAHEYAQALRSALDRTAPARVDEVIDRFATIVRKRGHGRLLPKIVAALSRGMILRERRVRTEVAVADATVIKTHAVAISEHARALGVPPETVTFVVDDTLIAGYRIRTRDRVLDASGKRALIELYRRLIA